MNIDDLRQSLATISQEVDPLDEANRIAAVDALVVRARRRRVATGIGCATFVAVLALVAPNLLHTGDGGPRPANHPSTKRSAGSVLPTVEDLGTRFYTSPAGDTLLGERMGRPGQRAVTLRVVPTTTDLSYRSLCWGLRSPGGRLAYDVSADSSPLKSSSCDAQPYGPLGPDTRFGSSPRANRDGWRTVGVVPGKPIRFRVSLRPGVHPGSAASPIQLGIAVYADTGPVVHDHGVWFAREVVVDGHTYSLVRRRFGDVAGVRGHLRLDLPRAPRPLYVVYGVASAHSSYDLEGDSSGAHSATAGPSSTGEMARLGQQTAHLRVRLHRRPGALIYVLAYERTD
jgi:hypothetical protein